MRRKIGAILAVLGLVTTGLVVTAPTALAATPCSIIGFGPRTVTVGLKQTKVRVEPRTTGCTVKDWDVHETEGFALAGTMTDPFSVVYPHYVNVYAGLPMSVTVSAYNGEDWTERTFPKSLTFKRQTTWQAKSFNASPEPVKKGKKVTIKGRALVAAWLPAPDWKAYWAPLKSTTVQIQFRTKTGTYKTVKTVKTGSTGWMNTKIKASKSGYWRVHYAGAVANNPVTTAGDYVKVKR